MLKPSGEKADRGMTGVLHVIAFGFVATFMSSFGQTFFVGLFAPEFGAAAGIGGTTVSLFYGIATLVSGSLLFWLGGAMDRLTLRLAVAISLVILIVGCLLTAGIQTGAMLLIAFFMLRLGGQGLLTQLAVVAATRNGGERRGMTVAWASMGVILGEAILPATVIAALTLLYWRHLWLVAAALLLVVVLPTLLVLQRRIHWRESANERTSSGKNSDAATLLRRRTLLADRRFWAGAAIMLIPPFMATGFLFEQSTITRAMNWNPGLIGAAFTVFAVSRAFGTWFYGQTTDRFGTIRMARVHLFPMALAFCSLALPLGGASIWVAFAGIGFTNGANSVLSGALWADLYGTAAVGTVRGVFGAAMVLASALAPVTVAAAMSSGLSAAGLGLVFGIYAVVVPMLAGPFLYSRCDARPDDSMRSSQ